MTFIRGLAAGVLLAGAAVGLASPASADPTVGEYTATIIDPAPLPKKGPVEVESPAVRSGLRPFGGRKWARMGSSPARQCVDWHRRGQLHSDTRQRLPDRNNGRTGQSQCRCRTDQERLTWQTPKSRSQQSARHRQGAGGGPSAETKGQTQSQSEWFPTNRSAPSAACIRSAASRRASAFVTPSRAER